MIPRQNQITFRLDISQHIILLTTSRHNFHDMYTIKQIIANLQVDFTVKLTSLRRIASKTTLLSR